jgi:hypothetical protein
MEHRLKDDIPVQIARRKFLAGIGAAAAATAAAPLPGQALMTATPPRVPMDSSTSSQKTGQPHVMNVSVRLIHGRRVESAASIRRAGPRGHSPVNVETSTSPLLRSL